MLRIFFFQAEDGIRDRNVTGVQTCALPISAVKLFLRAVDPDQMPQGGSNIGAALKLAKQVLDNADRGAKERVIVLLSDGEEIGRASCRERVLAARVMWPVREKQSARTM